jgi:hypothetical protein
MKEYLQSLQNLFEIYIKLTIGVTTREIGRHHMLLGFVLTR